MNSFATYLSYLPKKLMAIVSALSVVALVTANVSAAFGPNRPTKPYLGTGTSGFNYVTFNSFTDVPNFGDERDFLRGKLNGSSNAYADPVSALKDGDQVKVLVYVHNGADPSLNASGTGVAHDLRVRIQLPTGTATSQDLTGFINAANASPAQITDTLSLNATDKFSVEYVPGTAKIDTASLTNVALSDNLVTSGVVIGDDALDGNMNGCFEFYAYVTFIVKVNIEEEPQPILECKTLTALPAAVRPDEEVTFTATANAENGATITKYVFNFGDGDDTTVTTSAETASTTHSYDETGTYNASVTTHFTVNGQAMTRSGDNCKDSVDVEEEPKDIEVCRDGKVITIKEDDRLSTDTNPPCPAKQIQVCRDGKVITIDEEDRKSTDTNAPCVLGEKELPNTGVGSALAGFFGTSALFASARTWLSSRRQLRAGALKQG